MKSTQLHWGILGASRISEDFCNTLGLLPKDEHKVVAVAARNLDRSKQFADKCHIPKAYGSYEELVADPELDVIYIGNENTAHKDAILIALAAKKAVVCEKPLCINAREAEECIKFAQQQQCFLIEGLWSRFFPIYEEIRKCLASNSIGNVKLVTTEFGVNFANLVKPDDIRFKKEKGGGAILDIGCYALQFLLLACSDQMPKAIKATGTLFSSGIDDTTSVSLEFPNGVIGNAIISGTVNLKQCARICGTSGTIEIPADFFRPEKVYINGTCIDDPIPIVAFEANFTKSQGFIHEAKFVRECLMKGANECPLMPLNATLTLAKVMDEVRRQVGVVFPQDH